MRFLIYRKKDNGDIEVQEYDYKQPEEDGYKMPMAHCDQTILHAPGQCQFCDHYPEAQALRKFWKINFTGEHDDGKAPCPSEYFRSEKDRDSWPGNTSGGYFW